MLFENWVLALGFAGKQNEIKYLNAHSNVECSRKKAATLLVEKRGYMHSDISEANNGDLCFPLWYVDINI